MNNLFIVIPAYNEELNILNTINQWYPVIERHNSEGQSRIVVINDGSTDQTFSLLTEAAKSHPLLLPLTKSNGGHGSSVLYGYQYALSHGADYIFQTDSDGQTDPDEFEQFWEQRNSYDAILGNRSVRGDGKPRKFIENTVCLLLRLIFGVRIPDANAPYRLMKADLLQKYINKLPADFNIPNIMLSTYFMYFHESVKFIDISFRPRQGGTNSVNFKKIMKIGWKALGDFHRLKKEL